VVVYLAMIATAAAQSYFAFYSLKSAGCDVSSEVLCAAVTVLRILAELRSGDSMSETPNRSVGFYLLQVPLLGDCAALHF
jgi:hypothetical protein